MAVNIDVDDESLARHTAHVNVPVDVSAEIQDPLHAVKDGVRSCMSRTHRGGKE